MRAITSSLKAVPRSRKDIRVYAEEIKKKLGIHENERLDIIKIFELMSLICGFDYEIVEDKELPNKYAETDVVNEIIRIRENVYNGAANGNPRDRFTIAHELGHYCLHSSSLSLARTISDIKIYEDPEWQANVFAAEFLVPTSYIKNLTVSEIVNKYNVSFEVAQIQLEQSKKEPFF